MYEITINLCEPYKLYESNRITINQFIWEVVQTLKSYYSQFPYLKSFSRQLSELSKKQLNEYDKSEELEAIMEEFYSYCEDKQIEVNSNYFEPDDDYYC